MKIIRKCFVIIILLLFNTVLVSANPKKVSWYECAMKQLDLESSQTKLVGTNICIIGKASVDKNGIVVFNNAQVLINNSVYLGGKLSSFEKYDVDVLKIYKYFNVIILDKYSKQSYNYLTKNNNIIKLRKKQKRVTSILRYNTVSKRIYEITNVKNKLVRYIPINDVFIFADNVVFEDGKENYKNLEIIFNDSRSTIIYKADFGTYEINTKKIILKGTDNVSVKTINKDEINIGFPLNSVKFGESIRVFDKNYLEIIELNDNYVTMKGLKVSK